MEELKARLIVYIIGKGNYLNKDYILDGLISGSIWIGTRLAARFGLHTQYFNAIHRESCKIEGRVWMTGGLVLVELPMKIQQLLNEGYVSVKMNHDDLEDGFDYVFNMTDRTRIGFYK